MTHTMDDFARDQYLSIVARLDAGGDPRAFDNFALRWACMHGHRAVANRLLALGLTAADVREAGEVAVAMIYRRVERKGIRRVC